MYTKFFGLQESPFSIAPDPRYLYMSERHRESLAHLLYGVGNQGGFVLLTGEVGTGKTTVCQCFLQQIPDNTEIAFIIHPKLTGRELLATICDELRIPYERLATVKVLVDQINQHLLRSHAQGKNTLVIIDEAQNLSTEVLEQLRLLTNLETAEKKLLQVVLLGQPELNQMLERPELRQLSQRITARYHLKALSRDDVRAYVNYRLSVAGLKREVFTPGALTALYRLSQGVPRLINLICDRALLGAYARHSDVVDRVILKQAAREVLGGLKPRSSRVLPAWALKGVAAGLTVGLVMAASLTWLRSFELRSFVGEGSLVAESQDLALSPDANIILEGGSFQAEMTASLLPADSSLTPSNAVGGGEQGAARMMPGIPDPGLVNVSTSTARVGLAKLNETTSIGGVTAPEGSALTVAEDVAQFLKAIAERPPDSEASAYRSIFQRWGIDYEEQWNPSPCDHAEEFGLRCLHRSGTWRSLLQLDRPAVLQLRDTQGVAFHLALLGVEPGGRAWVRIGDQPLLTSLQVLDEFWAGSYSLLWRLPPSRVDVIRASAAGADNQWLAMRLSQIESRHAGRSAGESLEHDVATVSLEQRVKQFQLGVGLVPDGIAGAHTLIHMSTLLDPDVPRLISNGVLGGPAAGFGQAGGADAPMEETN